MTFYLQLGAPRITGARDQNDGTLCEAMQTAFELIAEDALLVWCGVHIPLSYKYDLSFMLDDVIEMVRRICTVEGGCMEIAWASNTFRCDWTLKWTAETVAVNVKWDLIEDPLQEILSRFPQVEVSRDAFLAEWGGLVHLVSRGLRASGYPETLTEAMDHLVAKLPGRGIDGYLYRQGKPF